MPPVRLHGCLQNWKVGRHCWIFLRKAPEAVCSWGSESVTGRADTSCRTPECVPGLYSRTAAARARGRRQSSPGEPPRFKTVRGEDRQAVYPPFHLWSKSISGVDPQPLQECYLAPSTATGQCRGPGSAGDWICMAHKPSPVLESVHATCKILIPAEGLASPGWRGRCAQQARPAFICGPRT